MPIPPFSNAPTLPATFNLSGKVKQTVYNVKDYGVVGNGITDDTAAINTAFSAASGGGILYFPPGIYLISTTITLLSNTTIQGAGRDVTVITCSSGMSTPIFSKVMSTIDFLHDWSICDLSMDGASGAATRGILIDSSASNAIPFYGLYVYNVEFRNFYIGLFHGANNLNAAFYVWNFTVSECRFITNFFGYIMNGVYSEWVTDCYFGNNSLCALMSPSAFSAPSITGSKPGTGPNTMLKVENIDVQNTNPDYVNGTDSGIIVAASQSSFSNIIIAQTSQIAFGFTNAEEHIDSNITDLRATDCGGGFYLNSVDPYTGGTLNQFMLHSCGQKSNWSSFPGRQMPLDMMSGNWKVSNGTIVNYGNHTSPPHAIEIGNSSSNSCTLMEFSEVSLELNAYSPQEINYMDRPSFEDGTFTGWTFTGTGTPTINSSIAKFGTKSLDLSATTSYVASYSVANIPPTYTYNRGNVTPIANVVTVNFWYNNGTPTVELVQNGHSYGVIVAPTWVSGWQQYQQTITMQNSTNPLIINLSIPNGVDMQVDGFSIITAPPGLSDATSIAYFDGGNTSSASITYNWTGLQNISTSTRTFDPYYVSSSQPRLSLIFKDCIGVNPDSVSELGNVTGMVTFDRMQASYYVATLTGNITITMPAAQGLQADNPGDVLMLQLIQDATGARIATWPANVNLAGGSLILSTTANAIDSITFRWDGADWNEVSRALSNAGGRVIQTISSNTNAAAANATDYVYVCSASLTLTMPTAVGNTNRYTVKYTGSTTVTIATTGGQTIDGSSSITILPNDSVDLISTGVNWYII